MLKRSWHFFLVLLIEGAALMAVELMGAKLIAPFYGSSLYVWTSVLAITVSGLTLGYFLGGRVSVKPNAEKLLTLILGISAVLVFAMPYTTHALNAITKGFGLIAGVCFTSLLLLLPPMLCFGMAGPIIVRRVAVRTETLGNTTGSVYFTSTCSGIVATFLFGYCLIPEAGLKFSALATAIALACAAIVYAIKVWRNPVISEEPQPIPKQNTADKNNKQVIPSIYLFAILEGASVMVVELIAARMIAPYFGASLYAWSAVIGATLLGLALGYYFGGKLADKYTGLNTLYWVLLIASVFLMFMHYSSEHLTIAFENVNMRSSVIIVSLLLVLPPLICLGMVPILLIRHITMHVNNAGKIAGNVFTISSASGIIALFLTGFYIIPQLGLTNPSIITGIIVGAIPFYKLISRKKYVALLFVGAFFISLAVKQTVHSTDDIKVQYYSEGLLGQILITDVTDNSNVNRALFVNRFGESFVNIKTGTVEGDYIIYASALASKYPENANMLILGLGAGSMANISRNNLKSNVDAVELDERIPEIAHEYFNLNKDVNVIIDDARHYIETTSKKYDVIFFDVFHGDETPSYVYSVESFIKAKSLLNKNGIIIVNFFGFLNGNMGKAGRSVYKTITAAGLQTKILPTSGKEEDRNLLFVASNENQSFSILRTPLFVENKPVNVDSLFIDVKSLDLKNAIVLTDDRPILDRLSMNESAEWRKFFTETITQYFLKSGIPLFQ